MTRSMKIFAVALAALLAVSAAAAQAATAEEFFHSHAENTVVTGEADPTEPNGVLTLYNAEATEEVAFVSCEEARLEGLQTGTEHESEAEGTTYTTQEATLHPEYVRVQGVTDPDA